MAVIDLGEVTGAEHASAGPVDHRRLLRAGLSVLSIAGLLVIAGAAPGPTTGVRPLWTTSIDNGRTLALDERTAYVSRLEDGRPTVAAYDLASGRLRWSAPVGDGLGAEMAPRPAGDTVLAPADPASMTYQDNDGSRLTYVSALTTVALDAATGDQLWRANGDARPSAGTGTALIAEHDDQVRTTRLRLVRLRDGDEVWSRSTPPLVDWIPLPDHDHPETIATATADGRLSVYGYADGKLRATSQVPWETKTRSATLIPAGRNLAVVRDDASRDTITTVYSAGDLRPRWTAGDVSTCGELVCSIGVEGVAGRDPDTGRVVWNAPDARNMYPVAADRVLLSTTLDGATVRLADSRTGRPVGRPVTGAQAYTDDPAGDLLFTRPSVDPPGRLVVTRLDLADGRQTSIGTFGPTGDESSYCLAARTYLACLRPDGLHVMAVGS